MLINYENHKCLSLSCWPSSWQFFTVPSTHFRILLCSHSSYIIYESIIFAKSSNELRHDLFMHLQCHSLQTIFIAPAIFVWSRSREITCFLYFLPCNNLNSLLRPLASCFVRSYAACIISSPLHQFLSQKKWACKRGRPILLLISI